MWQDQILRGTELGKGDVLVYCDSNTNEFFARLNFNHSELAKIVVASGSLQDLATQLTDEDLIHRTVVAGQLAYGFQPSIRLLTSEERSILRQLLAGR